MIALLGRSGSGKDTVQQALMRLGVPKAVPYTTRPPRPGEQDGVHYHFITGEQFLQMEADRQFLASSSYRVADGSIWRYGIGADSLETGCCVQTNPKQFDTLLARAGGQMLSVCLTADSWELAGRRGLRGDDPNEITRRMKAELEDFRGIECLVDAVIPTDGGLTPDGAAAEILRLHKEKFG